jgi:hypothetical protein
LPPFSIFSPVLPFSYRFSHASRVSSYCYHGNMHGISSFSNLSFTI